MALFRRHLLEDLDLYSQLPDLLGAVLVCHCRPEEACHGDVLTAELSNFTQLNGAATRAQQIGQATFQELFAGAAQLTKSVQNAGVPTAPPPVERSEEERKQGLNTAADLAQDVVVENLLDEIWSFKRLYLGIATPCDTFSELRDKPLPGNDAPQLRSTSEPYGLAEILAKESPPCSTSSCSTSRWPSTAQFFSWRSPSRAARRAWRTASAATSGPSSTPSRRSGGSWRTSGRSRSTSVPRG